MSTFNYRSSYTWKQNMNACKQINKQKTNCERNKNVCLKYQQNIMESLTKSSAVSAKNIKTMKYLRKILFSLIIMNRYLLTCLHILFKRRFESVIKVLLFEIDLANHKVLEPTDL